MTVTFSVISHFTKTYVHWLYVNEREIAIVYRQYPGCTKLNYELEV